MTGPRVLACPASLKGVLTSGEAASALGKGFDRVGIEWDSTQVTDGGEGTVVALCGDEVGHYDVRDAFGRPRSALVGRLDDALVVEAAQVLPFDAELLDATAASSRGLGELLAQLRAPRFIVGLGGTATMDAGAGLLDVLSALPAPTTVLCDVQTTLYDAPRLFGPQKGATPEQVEELEARFRSLSALAPFAGLPGSGAAGGLGAALASLGAELVPGARTALDLVGLEVRGYDLVVTGEGRVDATTAEGKAPAEVVRRCADAGIPCVVFGGIVSESLAGVETIALSGDPARATDDLVELGRWLGARLVDVAR
jgi:glycerate 2-kinase